MKKLWCNIKEWKQEVIGLLFAISLFLFSPIVLRWIDPTAGAYDAGVLHIIIFAGVAMLSFSFLSWLGVKLNFSEVFNYLQTNFIKDFESLDKWQKIKVSLLLYLSYLTLFVLVASAL